MQSPPPMLMLELDQPAVATAVVPKVWGRVGKGAIEAIGAIGAIEAMRSVLRQDGVSYLAGSQLIQAEKGQPDVVLGFVYWSNGDTYGVQSVPLVRGLLAQVFVKVLSQLVNGAAAQEDDAFTCELAQELTQFDSARGAAFASPRQSLAGSSYLQAICSTGFNDPMGISLTDIVCVVPVSKFPASAKGLSLASSLVTFPVSTVQAKYSSSSLSSQQNMSESSNFQQLPECWVRFIPISPVSAWKRCGVGILDSKGTLTPWLARIDLMMWMNTVSMMGQLFITRSTLVGTSPYSEVTNSANSFLNWASLQRSLSS